MLHAVSSEVGRSEKVRSWMRDLFRPSTLRYGGAYGLIVTGLVVPQILAYLDLANQHGAPGSAVAMIPAALFCHVFSGLVLFGWGGRPPMPGLFRDRATTSRGVGISVVSEINLRNFVETKQKHF